MVADEAGGEAEYDPFSDGEGSDPLSDAGSGPDGVVVGVGRRRRRRQRQRRAGGKRWRPCGGDGDEGPAGAGIQGSVDAVLREAGLDPKQMTTIDNSCPADGTSTAGVSKEDASKDKLEWKDVFELTEWFRPGTLKKNADFDPNAM